jgi:hypothetical protein
VDITFCGIRKQHRKGDRTTQDFATNPLRRTTKLQDIAGTSAIGAGLQRVSGRLATILASNDSAKLQRFNPKKTG